jgi:hypothetical protein
VKAILALALLGVLGFALAGCGATKKIVANVQTTPLPTISAMAVGKTPPGIALVHRIGAVTFAEPRGEVTKALGRGVPASIDGGHRLRFYRRTGIYIQYASSRGKQFAVIVLTRSPRYKTRLGVGVGSSLDQLRSRVGVTCERPSSPSQRSHQGANINRPLTVFNLDAAERVVEVALAPGGD